MNALANRKPVEEIKNVGIWIRVSTEDQARGESPEHHERRARAYAEAKGWTVREVYHLEGVSGKAVMHHPEAVRMLAEIKSGHIQGLIFSKLARLARNTRDLLDFADLFRKSNADLISLQESIDTSTPAGRLFYTMIAAMAQWEREEIAERVAVSVPIRAKLGKPLGAAPFGYQWKDKRLAIDPIEGPIRRQVYELFAEHRRKRVVARLLNEAGYRTRDKVEFTPLFVRRILTDPTSKGVRRVNYTRMVDNKVVLKPERDWMTVEVPPLVSEELWDQCNAIIADQRCSRRPVAKRRVQLFGGVAFCACGLKMYVRSNSPKYVCEKCRNKIPVVDLEKIFHEQLREFSLSNDEMEQYLSQADVGLKQKESMLKTLQSERQRVGAAMDRVYQLYIDGTISSEGFGTRYKPLEDQCRQLDEELPRLEAELDYGKVTLLSRGEILNNAKSLYERWPSLPYADKLQVAEALVDKITIGRDEVTVELCYLPSSQEMTKEAHNHSTSPPQTGPSSPHPLQCTATPCAADNPRTPPRNESQIWCVDPSIPSRLAKVALPYTERNCPASTDFFPHLYHTSDGFQPITQLLFHPPAGL